MKKGFERFDMNKPPVRTKWYLRPVIYLLSLPDIIKHKVKIEKKGTDSLKAPYILLCNHNAFMDFKVATKAIYPQRANYVVAIDGYIGREKLLRDVGCICKRKFTNNIGIVRQLKRVLENGDVAIIYPEARYSLCGTTAVLPESLGKMCKLFGAPVVTLICHGHHINSPFWNLHDRGVAPTEAEFSLLFTPEDLEELSVDEINKRIVETFQYDDYAWQKEKGIKVTYPRRAEGLHKVLYQCPCCKTEFKMATKNTTLYCESCGAEWEYSEDGELIFHGDSNTLPALPNGESFSHIPHWYEWERRNVRAEVEAGTYSSGVLKVHVDSLPNADKFIRLGNGTMVHDMNGFKVEGIDVDEDPFQMIKDVPSLYSCHIEYEYLGKFGDCVDLNTLTDTWYIYPEGDGFAVTKMALATEELYFHYKERKGTPCPPGLA